MSQESERISKRTEREESQIDATEAAPSAQKESLEVDDILDEIDATLEENAAAFVAAFVQKGGE